MFRKKWNLDRIVEDWTPPKVLVEYFPLGCFGEDREGHPVWYFDVGNFDPKGLCIHMIAGACFAVESHLQCTVLFLFSSTKQFRNNIMKVIYK